MAINFKQLFNFPWRPPVSRRSTPETIAKRQTQEVLRNEVEQIQFELEEERDFNRVETYKQQQLNIETQDSALSQQIQQGEITAAEIENEKRAKQNVYITAGVVSGAQIVAQAARQQIVTLGTRTGNVIKQERLQKATNVGTGILGIAGSFAVNPILGATAAVAFGSNLFFRQQQENFQRIRTSTDNALRLELLDGISQRGNR